MTHPSRTLSPFRSPLFSTFFHPSLSPSLPPLLRPLHQVCLVFPLLRGVLSQPSLLPGCEWAMMALDALWPSPSPNTSTGFDDDDDDDEGGLRWLEGPSPLASSRALLPLHASLTFTVLSALHRMPRLEPPPAAVLARVIAEYPRLRLAGETSGNKSNKNDGHEKKSEVGALSRNHLAIIHQHHHSPHYPSPSNMLLTTFLTHTLPLAPHHLSHPLFPSSPPPSFSSLFTTFLTHTLPLLLTLLLTPPTPSPSFSHPLPHQWLGPLLGGAGLLSSEPHVRLACLAALARLFGEDNSHNNNNHNNNHNNGKNNGGDAIITAAADNDTLGDDDQPTPPPPPPPPPLTFFILLAPTRQLTPPPLSPPRPAAVAAAV